ncbi:hypothetical protein [Cryptosporangium arvum]|uniref:Uncharacterized protein n=1 Tax=Cryptosporangium arvum DSM 44712 TaxID=927661 RepID=A0A010Z4Y4_9ACTN|nr:hypothetical protein [Cryptosporangium arvum]EXG82408.1 hypothetical protein CryarDRAFT_3591 [Cryptosporangium arvum DSM 44712]
MTAPSGPVFLGDPDAMGDPDRRDPGIGIGIGLTDAERLLGLPRGSDRRATA